MENNQKNINETQKATPDSLSTNEDASTSSTFAAENITNGTYKIAVPEEGGMVEGKVVDFGAAGREQPLLWRDHKGLNQRWEFKYDAGKDAYQIINKADGRILAYNTTYGTDYTALVTENQHKPEHYWHLEDAGDGKVYLVNNEGFYR